MPRHLAVGSLAAPWRLPEIQIVGEHERRHWSFIHGFEKLPVVIPARA